MAWDSIAKAARAALASDPALRQCVEAGVASPTRVARAIKPAVEAMLGRPVREDSLKVAVARLMGRPRPASEAARVLAGSSVELRSGITVVAARPAAAERAYAAAAAALPRARFFSMVQSPTAITIAADSAAAEAVWSALGGDALAKEPGLAAVVVVSPEDIMRVPGVLAALSQALASEGINVVHASSSYADTVFVVSEADALRAYEALRGLVEGLRRAGQRA